MNTTTKIVGLTGFFALLLALPIIIVLQRNKESTQSHAEGITGSTITTTQQPTTQPINTQNAFDTTTSGLELSNGQWTDWYSTSVIHKASQAHIDTHSLQVTVNANNGWGIHLLNWPGFAATPGQKTISFWGLKGVGTTDVTMEVTWLNTSNKPLQTNQLVLPSLTTVWQEASSTVNAPAGTTHGYVSFIGTGSKGTIIYLDDIFVSK